jgi:hypothetical protein
MKICTFHNRRKRGNQNNNGDVSSHSSLRDKDNYGSLSK